MLPSLSYIRCIMHIFLFEYCFSNIVDILIILRKNSILKSQLSYNFTNIHLSSGYKNIIE